MSMVGNIISSAGCRPQLPVGSRPSCIAPPPSPTPKFQPRNLPTYLSDATLRIHDTPIVGGGSHHQFFRPCFVYPFPARLSVIVRRTAHTAHTALCRTPFLRAPVAPEAALHHRIHVSGLIASSGHHRANVILLSGSFTTLSESLRTSSDALMLRPAGPLGTHCTRHTERRTPALTKGVYPASPEPRGRSASASPRLAVRQLLAYPHQPSVGLCAYVPIWEESDKQKARQNLASHPRRSFAC